MALTDFSFLSFLFSGC